MKTSRHHQQQPTPSRNIRDMRILKPPERPLVPYMRFSKKRWPQVHKENPETQLLEIGKIIGQLWREASDGEKAMYQQEYENEKLEYDRNLKAYQAALTNQHTMASRSRMNNTSNDGSAAIQAVDEEDPLEMTKKRLSAIRFERDSRLMAELFTGACLPDTRTMVPQSRIEQLKRQATSLSAHQNKLNGELEGLEEKFQKRKKDLQESSDKFNEKMKALREDRPTFTEEKYREYAQMWTDYIRQKYSDFKEGKPDTQDEVMEVSMGKVIDENAMEVDESSANKQDDVTDGGQKIVQSEETVEPNIKLNAEQVIETPTEQVAEEGSQEIEESNQPEIAENVVHTEDAEPESQS